MLPLAAARGLQVPLPAAAHGPLVGLFRGVQSKKFVQLDSLEPLVDGISQDTTYGDPTVGSSSPLSYLTSKIVTTFLGKSRRNLRDTDL